MSKPSSSRILSVFASTLFSKRAAANKAFPFPNSIGVNCTRIKTVGDKIMTQDIKYCSAWFLRSEKGLYVCGHAEMLLSSGDGEAEIIQGLRNFRHLVSDNEKLELIVASRMGYDDKLSTLRDMVFRNQEKCVSTIKDGCKNLGLTISDFKLESIGSSIIVIDGKEIKDLSRPELFINLLNQDNDNSNSI